MPRSGAVSSARTAAVAIACLISIPGGQSAGQQPEPRTLVVGINDDFPPFEFVSAEGEPVGFDVDLIKAIAHEADQEIEIRAGRWSDIRAGLIAGDIDILAGMLYSDRRDERIAFSDPHLRVNYSIFVRDDEEKMKSVRDLEGKTVLVEERSIMHDFMRQRGHEDLILARNGPQALQRLSRGEGDCALLAYPAGILLTRYRGIDNIKSVGRPVFRHELCFAVREDRAGLLHRLDAGLVHVRRSGEYQDIFNTWIAPLETSGLPYRRIATILGIVTAAFLLGLLTFRAWNRALRLQVERKTKQLESSRAARFELELRLSRAQKMEALGQLASGVAHDFNNLLSAMFGFSEIVKQQLPEDSPAQSDMDEIVSAGRRARELVDQILTFSRGGKFERKEVNVEEVVAEGVSLLEGTRPDNVRIENVVQPDCHPVCADPGQIIQVILNVGANAFQAMSDQGGVLTIRAENAEVLEGWEITEGTLTPGDYVVLSFRDTGRGMDAKTIEHIFEPYFSTKDRVGGTGLGMSIVHGIVSVHGGGIQIDSRSGKGTTVEVYLPALTDDSPQFGSVSPAEMALEAQSPAVQLQKAPKGKRVLLVEDEEHVLRLAHRLLESHGFFVNAFSRSDEAASAFEASPDLFDVLVTDQEMRAPTGAELARRLRTIRPELPVVICTGHPYTIDVGDTVSAEFQGYVGKPLSAERLIEVVTNAITQRKPT